LSQLRGRSLGPSRAYRKIVTKVVQFERAVKEPINP
jgi:hypothetical protein